MTSSSGDIVGPIPTGVDADSYDRLRRRVLWSLPTGLYVLGTRAGHQRNLMTVSWVTQVAQEPKMVGVGVECGSRTHELLIGGGVFTLSLLARRDRALVRRFVKPVQDVDIDEETGMGAMNDVPVRSASTGAPFLDVAVAWIDCEIRHTLPLGSHSWFVGEVVDVGATEPESPVDDDGRILRMEDTRMNYGG